MLRLDIKNFRNLREVNIEEDRKVLLITGYNNSGKTSLKSAIQFAFTGEAFGKRGTGLNSLLTHGEAGGLSVRVTLDEFRAYRTLSGGDPQKAIAQRLGIDASVLPLAFNQTLCGDGGSKALGAFLAGAGATTFDPFVHFASDTELKAYLDLCRQAGKLTPGAIVSYATTMRAAQKPPGEPVRPEGMRPDRQRIANLESEIADYEETVAVARETIQELQETSRSLQGYWSYKVALDEYERKVREVEETQDDSGLRRQHTRLSSMNLRPAEAIAEEVLRVDKDLAAELAAVLVRVADLQKQANAWLTDNPPPMPPPQPPVPPADLEALQAKVPYEALPALMQEVSKELEQAQDIRDGAQGHATDRKNDLRALERALGAWEAYDKAMPEWETNVERAKAEWKRWDRVVKEVEVAEKQHLASVGDHFGKLVSDISTTILNGRRVSVDRVKGIHMGPIPIEELSESERWRVEVSICAAIARTLNSPIFIADGVDILDARNRQNFTRFVMERVAPHFKAVVLTMTCPGDIKDEKPAPAELADVVKYTITDGVLTRLA